MLLTQNLRREGARAGGGRELMSSKSKIARISLIVALVLALALTLSACNFFDGVSKIKKVDISVTNNLNQNNNGEFEVCEGGEIELSVSWHNIMIDKPNLRWFVAVNDGEKQEIDGEKDKTLKYKAGITGTVYKFSASANSVDSENLITVRVISGVNNVSVAIVSGLGEKNSSGQYEVEAGGEFSLVVNWQETIASSKRVEWFVSSNGGEKTLQPSQTNKTSTWSAITVGMVYVISAEVNDTESANSITVLVVAGETPAAITFGVQITGIEDTDSDNYKEARFGDLFSVSVDFGGLLVEDPIFDWFVEEDGVERKLEGTNDGINFTIQSRSISKYEFKAVLKGDEDVPSSNKGKVEFVDFTLDQVALLASPSIVAGRIRQNICGSLEDVVLTAVWNEAELPEDIVTIEWRVDNVLQSETSKTFTYDVGGIVAACEKTVKVTIRYKAQTVNTTVLLSFVNSFVAVSKVTISVVQNGEVNPYGSGLQYTYKMTSSTMSNPGSVTVNANVNPDGTDLSTPCTWTIRDLSGTRTVAGTGRTNTIALSYGKNVITATIDNIESRSIIIYALTSSDLHDRRHVIQDTFIWDGSVQDHYINNQEELNMFIGYLVSTHKTAPDAGSSSPNVHTYYLAPPAWRDGVNTTPAFATARSLALSLGVDESGGAAISIYGNEKICLTDDSTLGEPEGAIATDYVVSQENVYVRYKEVSYEESRSKLPVDDFAETMDVENSNQLMRAVMWGYKPNIVGENAVALGQLYSKARSMLLKYVGKNMSELEKVAVIYDWLVNEVDYDYKAAYESSDINVYAYYLEGVFNFVSIDSKSGWDARAVCDGKSKAFALLCGMEGIRAERIIGTAGDEGDEAHWTGHAWNKVLIDVDGDGVREWFAIDCTWGDVAINTDGTGKHKKEYLSYEYYLVSDDFIDDTHASDIAQPLATTEIDIYDLIEINGTTLDITTQDQLLKLYLYSGGHDSIKIRCRIADSVMVNAGTRSSLTNDEEDVYYYSAA